MSGTKIANENATNFSVGEPMGGYGGSYSVLANFPGTTTHVFAWRTRSAVNLELNDFMTYAKHNDCGSYQRTPNGNVAVAVLSDKATLVGPEAIAQPGAHDGDAQVSLVTTGATIDHSNVRVEAFDGQSAMLAWEQIDAPACDKPSYDCKGAFSGTYFQQIDAAGKTVGAPIKRDDVFVSGDIARMSDGRLCWPYVNGLAWDLSKPFDGSAPNATATKMSFACMTLDRAGTGNAPAPLPPATSSSAVAQALPPSTTLSTSTYTPVASSPLVSNQRPPVKNAQAPANDMQPPNVPLISNGHGAGGADDDEVDECEVEGMEGAN